MDSHKKMARIAGFWYLLMAITAPIGILYVPAKLIVPGDAAVTAQNILASELLFRAGLVSRVLCQLAFIWLVLALYRLLKGVNAKHARLMVALVLVAVPIAFLNELNQLAALVLLGGADFLKVFAADHLHALMMVFLKIYEQGNVVVEIFWGLWLLPFGWLVFKSGFFPKILGILLLIAGCGYVVTSLTGLLLPQYLALVNSIVSVPEGIGELAMVAWLLIKGAKTPKASVAAADYHA